MTFRPAALLVILAASCGPSAADIRGAQESVYQADREVVWKAVVDEMKERYPDDGLKVENAEAGYVESKWKPVETTQEATQGDSTIYGAKAQTVRGQLLFRTLVKIEGGPPWKIYVDGQAAQFRPEMSVLAPFKHGQIDEPKWVPGRIDALRASIHGRLKAYAIKAPATP